jgi:5,10-methylenetetrahydrofolate reductase
MTTIAEKRDQDRDAIVFICDFSPPRGSDPALLEGAQQIGADFISVAYNPGKSTRVNSTLAAGWIQANAPQDVLFALATRDMNKVAAESLLLGADLMGLQNVLVVGGDPFTEKELASVKSVDDFKPTELLGAIGSMNQGLDYRGRKLRSPTSLCAGAAIDLSHDLERETRLVRRKAESGAAFFLMQPIFDPKRLSDFLEGYELAYGEALAPPIFCGLQVMAPDSIMFGDIPGWVTDDLSRGRTGEDIASKLLDDFVSAGIRSIYLVPPIMKGGRRDYEAAASVIESYWG